MIFNVATTDNTFVYNCNGEHDNTNLVTLIQNLRNRGLSNFTIEIVGAYNADAVLTVDNSGYTQITLDFSKCNRIVSKSNFINVKNVRVINAAVYYNQNTPSAGVSSFIGENATFENCRVTGGFTSGACVVFNGTDSTFRNCTCDIYNAGGTLSGITGTGNSVTTCNVKVKSNTASTYGVNVEKSFVSDSFFQGETGSAETTHSGSGGRGGGYFANCEFVGLGALKGQGFYVTSGAWFTAFGCRFRGYTKNTSSGWGVGLLAQPDDASTVALFGINCNQIALTSYSQTKSFEMLSGYGVYSGVFYAAPSVAETITSIGAWNRNRG